MQIRSRLNERGIGCGRYFAPIHLQPPIDQCLGEVSAVGLPVTESQAERTLALPFFNRIKSEQIAEVCDMLLEVLAAASKNPPNTLLYTPAMPTNSNMGLCLNLLGLSGFVAG